MAYLIERSIGSFYWALNPDSRDTGGLLGPDWQPEGPTALSSRKLSMLARLEVTRLARPPISPPPPEPASPPPPPWAPGGGALTAGHRAGAWLAGAAAPALLLAWLAISFLKRHKLAAPPPDCTSTRGDRRTRTRARAHTACATCV